MQHHGRPQRGWFAGGRGRPQPRALHFLDDEGTRVGTVSLQSPTIAAEALANAMDATDALRDGSHETYYAQLKCHNPSGDDYDVTFTRKTVRISSYQDEAVKAKVET